MTATILSDNRTDASGIFVAEHGLSVLLDTSERQILLDTGASDIFLQNARRLGVDLSQVDYVFLSHGHADHTGGLSAFLDINRKAKVIVSPHALDGRFCSMRGGMHSITCEWPMDKMQGRTIRADETGPVDGGLYVIACIGQKHALPLGNRNLLVERGTGLVPDDFCHEIALYTDGFLFTGCAHNGIGNILDACPWPVRTVLGGFHLPDAHRGDSYESEAALTALAGELAERYPGTSFWTGHCTGDAACRTMQSVMGERLHQFRCGMTISVESSSNGNADAGVSQRSL